MVPLSLRPARENDGNLNFEAPHNNHLMKPADPTETIIHEHYQPLFNFAMTLTRRRLFFPAAAGRFASLCLAIIGLVTSQVQAELFSLTASGTIAKNNSAVEGVMLLTEHGVPAAAVGTMSARLGEGSSTWNDGVISVINPPAAARGIKVGMTAKEAARLMLQPAGR